MSRPFSVLFIDTAYSLREIREKQHESFFRARHASGLFKRVWSVHPVADLVGPNNRSIDIVHLDRNQAVIEGKAALFRLPKFMKPLNVLLSQYRLYKLLVRLVRTRDIPLIVAVDPYLSGLLGLAVARRTGRPFVLRISGNHDDLFEAAGALAMPRLLPTYRLQKWVQRFALRRADLVTGINRNNLAFGVANGARKKTAIIPISSNIAAVHRAPPSDRPSGVDFLRKYGATDGKAVLLYVGRLLDLKHPDDALRAMAVNIRRFPGTIGILAGTGQMLDELRQLARDLGVADAVHFVGQLDQPTLSRIVPHCIMLSPSAGQLALMEGGLGGAPIVAYDRDFQPEFIDDGVDGFIVPFRDHRAMAERVGTLIQDPDLARRFSAGIRDKALFHIDPERVKRMEWDALMSVMPPAKPGRQGSDQPGFSAAAITSPDR